MTVASQESEKETKTVEAYLYLHSPDASPPAAQDELFRAFEQAVSSILSATKPGQVIRKHLLKQTFTVLNNQTATCTSLRALRQSASVTQVEASYGCEVVLLPGTAAPMARRPVRLAVFDMDSTLIDQEVIDELARSIGQTQAVGAITAAAMRGELDFAASLRKRVAMLRGVRADVWETLLASITVAQGARELCAYLKSRNVTMAVFSGGFQPMAEWLKGELGLDVAVANHLVTSPATAEFPFPHLAGELVEGQAIVHAEEKRRLLHELAAQHGIPLAEALCVGDGANDLPMLEAVGAAGGIAVACRAKPQVQLKAPNRLDTEKPNMRGLEELIWLFEESGGENGSGSGA